MKKILFLGGILFLSLIFGCEKYNEIKGKFVNYPFKNQKIIYLKDNQYVPDFIKIIFINFSEATNFLDNAELDYSYKYFKDQLEINRNNIFVIVYGWGIDPIVKYNEIIFSKEFIFHHKIYLPFEFKQEKMQDKLFSYSWGYNQGGFVTEFIDLYIFKKEDLIKEGSNQIDLDYTFKYKTSYDFEKEERWGIVSGNVTFNILADENVTINSGL
jgi:hypothetical protein